MESTKRIGDIATFFYIIGCILSLGSLWIVKVTIQKAIADSYKKY